VILHFSRIYLNFLQIFEGLNSIEMIQINQKEKVKLHCAVGLKHSLAQLSGPAIPGLGAQQQQGSPPVWFSKYFQSAQKIIQFEIRKSIAPLNSNMVKVLEKVEGTKVNNFPFLPQLQNRKGFWIKILGKN
jgi:hypothetical protein